MNPFQSLCRQENIKDVYKFQTTIGKGTYATVKKAIKKDGDGEEFAIKMIEKAKLTPEDLTALMQEIEILDQLDHPNVVKLQELYDEKDYFFMVFECMTGGELYSKFIEKENFSEEEVACALRPIIDALRYCHGLGVTHRDQKPENLLFENNEPTATQKIADFGFARFSHNNLMSTLCGTPCYIAPEIISNQPYNCSVDCWSIGVIIYLLLCGYPPFMEENNDKLFELIKKSDFSFPSKDWEDISVEAKDLIKRQLVVDATKRQTASEILNHEWMTKWS